MSRQHVAVQHRGYPGVWVYTGVVALVRRVDLGMGPQCVAGWLGARPPSEAIQACVGAVGHCLVLPWLGAYVRGA